MMQRQVEQYRMTAKQVATQNCQNWANRFRGGWSRCHASKKYLAGLWGNSDFELSEEVNAQNGTCHSGLQKLRRKQFAMELDTNPHEGGLVVRLPP
jgi:hypothetical protein